MPFGLGIGDFIATGELAERLYKEVVQVARKAPEEIRELSRDLMVIKASIDMLCEQLQDPDTALHHADENRAQAVTTVMKATKEILVKLERVANKHGLLNSSSQTRSRIQRGLDKLKFVQDAGTLRDLRARLNGQCNLIQLLLTNVNNSSLERLQTSLNALTKTHDMMLDLLRTAIHQQSLDAAKLNIPSKSQFQASFAPDRPPILSALEGSEYVSELLSMKFMGSVEQVRPWVDIGIDYWMELGRSFLARADWLWRKNIYLNQWGRDSEDARMALLNCFAELLKASWIVADILKNHPTRMYMTTAQSQMPIMTLNRLVADALTALRNLASKLPDIQQVLDEGDLSIFSSQHLPPLIAPSLDHLVRYMRLCTATSSVKTLFEAIVIYEERKYKSKMRMSEECIISLAKELGSARLELHIDLRAGFRRVIQQEPQSLETKSRRLLAHSWYIDESDSEIEESIYPGCVMIVDGLSHLRLGLAFTLNNKIELFYEAKGTPPCPFNYSDLVSGVYFNSQQELDSFCCRVCICLGQFLINSINPLLLGDATLQEPAQRNKGDNWAADPDTSSGSQLSLEKLSDDVIGEKIESLMNQMMITLFRLQEALMDVRNWRSQLRDLYVAPADEPAQGFRYHTEVWLIWCALPTIQRMPGCYAMKVFNQYCREARVPQQNDMAIKRLRSGPLLEVSTSSEIELPIHMPCMSLLLSCISSSLAKLHSSTVEAENQSQQILPNVLQHILWNPRRIGEAFMELMLFSRRTEESKIKAQHHLWAREHGIQTTRSIDRASWPFLQARTRENAYLLLKGCISSSGSQSGVWSSLGDICRDAKISPLVTQDQLWLESRTLLCLLYTEACGLGHPKMGLYLPPEVQEILRAGITNSGFFGSMSSSPLPNGRSLYGKSQTESRESLYYVGWGEDEAGLWHWTHLDISELADSFKKRPNCSPWEVSFDLDGGAGSFEDDRITALYPNPDEAFNETLRFQLSKAVNFEAGVLSWREDIERPVNVWAMGVE